MQIFDVKQSAQGANVFATGPTTVDIGISVDGLGRLRQQHSGIAVVSGPLASDQEIDRVVDQLISELEEIGARAKDLLASIKR